MTRGQADARGLKPHADCDPARVKASVAGEPRAAGSTAAGRSVTPVFVFVAAKEPSVHRGQLYHREHCTTLAKERRKLSVDDAAKQYWPCPKCKPPIRKRK